MPHIVLKHSNNISDCNFIPFFSNLHKLLVKNLGVKLTSCSSMVIPYSQYLIGDGNSKNAFVHLDIKVKPNINKEQLELTGSEALEMLKNHLFKHDNLNIKVSVDCLNVSPYFKS